MNTLTVDVLLKAYGELVEQRPLLTQTGTAGILTTFADVISQKLVEQKKGCDLRRTTIMAACALMYLGPLVSMWYVFLSMRGYSTGVNVFLDQFIMSPPLLFGFLVLQTILFGQGTKAMKHRIRHDLPDVLKINWLIWIPAQIVNFQFVPFQYRMLYSQSIALFWNCYLSYRTNNKTRIQPMESVM
ncbi:mitochondrial inner membrane protein Mpv17-like isoform X1 [Styela clava]